MRRYVTTLFLVAITTGAVFGQESTFRYATDPFTAESAEDAAKPDVPTTAEDADRSFESYEAAAASSQSLVQQKAIFRAEQRQLRIESRRWYGHSQSRPILFANPYMTNYSPLWIGHSWRPAARTWRGVYWY